jgi:hypothetical protein
MNGVLRTKPSWHGQGIDMGNIGIDYGIGRSNINLYTGIRYGVIPAQETFNCGADFMEAVYYDVEHSDECTGQIDTDCTCGADEQETNISHFEYTSEGYQLRQGAEDGDIFVIESPYYTTACFCSPCAPGACHLMNYHPEGPKTYCLGHDFFEGDKAPYPVYRVSDNSLILDNSTADLMEE